ncbi:MAG TPA: hypothetical protein VGI86_12850 [Acidimicrobiia bacterium]|jgi:hypothetical protein
MPAIALAICATALLAIFLTARRARDAALEAITTIATTRRELRPALVLARDESQRAGTMRLPHQR